MVQKKKSGETKEEKLNGSFDENNHESIIGDGNDNSDLVQEEIELKRNAQRSAKVKVVRYGEYDNDEDDDGIIHAMETDDENESDYMGSDSETEKKIKKANAKPKQPRKPKKAAANDGKTSVKKKSPTEEDASNAPIENQQEDDESSSKTKTEKPKKPRAKKEPGTTPKKEPKKPLNDLNQMIAMMKIFRSYPIHQHLLKSPVHNVVPLLKRVIIYRMITMMMKIMFNLIFVLNIKHPRCFIFV